MDFTVHTMLQALKQGSVSSEQLVSECLARINKTNHVLNAVYQISSKALADARIRDQQRLEGIELGSLHGIPVLIKVRVTHNCSSRQKS